MTICIGPRKMLRKTAIEQKERRKNCGFRVTNKVSQVIAFITVQMQGQGVKQEGIFPNIFLRRASNSITHISGWLSAVSAA